MGKPSEMEEGLKLFIITFLGLSFGSFFNVLIARIPEGLSIVRPGSRCPKCGHVLTWYENVPVLSWLWLRGKCSKCKAPISPRYIVVEILTGLLYLACYLRFGWEWPLVPALLLVSFLLPLAFIDAELWILPFELTIPGIVAGVAVSLYGGIEGLKTALVGGAIAFCAFRAVEYFGWLGFKKEAMGAGDKFLAALICSFLGARVLLGLFLLSAFQGSIVGIAGILITGRAGPKGEAAKADEEAEEAPATMTWEFTKPGLSFLRRLVLIPYCIFLQPIPDEPKDVEGNEVEWKPGPTNLPFGPWLALSALEILLFGPWLAEHIAYVGWVFVV